MSMYGKYRAQVVENLDPKHMGRIQVKCPFVYGESVSPWCLPCAPITGNKRGFFSPPQKGDTVWIEFEEGNTEKPIYSGGWWIINSAPSTDPDIEVFTSRAGYSIVFNNKAGEECIQLLDSNGGKITLKDNTVSIESTTVSITCENLNVV